MNRKTTGVIFVLLGCFLGFSFFVWSLVPFIQVRTFIKTRELKEILSIRSIFEPYTYVQPEIRRMFAYQVYNLDTRSKESLDFVREKMEEVIAKDQKYAKDYAALASVYAGLYQVTKDKAYIPLEEDALTQGLVLQPQSQKISYSYSVNLINQGRYDEAIDLMRKVVASTDYIAESHEYLGNALAAAGTEHFNEALDELEGAFNSGDSTITQGVAKKIYIDFLSYYAKKQDRERFIITLSRLEKIDTAHAETYTNIEQYLVTHTTLPNIIIGVE